MRLARRTLLTSALAAVAAPAVLRAARADAAPTTLKLHHFFSSVAGAHDRFLAPWARKVEAESGGRIRIEIFPSMELGGAPAHLFDQVHDGLADFVWAVPSHTPGRFPKIEAFELPFVPARRALVNSKALEDYAAANLKDEFREFHPICFSCRDSSALHAKRAIQSIADLKGLRLHVPNRLAADSVHALGAQGIAMPAPQVPMAIKENVIDGCLDPWDVLPGLKLFDPLKAHTDFAEASLSSTTFVLAMNPAAYDRLPRDLKAVIDANSGQVAAGMAGAMWDGDAAAVAATVRERGDAIATLAPEELARWRKLTDPVIANWVKEIKERRIDGRKLLADARTFLEKYANEPEPLPPQPPQAAATETVVARPQQTPPQQPPQVQAELPAPPKPAPAPVIPSAPAAKPPPKVLDIPL
jgi:TRAP-type C4-dicarboxylate transport system substrate-binding protein